MLKIIHTHTKPGTQGCNFSRSKLNYANHLPLFILFCKLSSSEQHACFVNKISGEG